MNDGTVSTDGLIKVNGDYYSEAGLMQSLRVTHRAAPAFKKFIDITFQEGPIQEVGINGAGIEDVIDVLVERLRGFNEGPTRCRENSLAITHLEEARNWLTRRTILRIQQGVEGSKEPHVS